MITSYVLGSIFLHEKLSKISIFSFLLAILGLYLVYIGDISIRADAIIPVIAAIASGMFFSIWFTLSKKISSKYPTPQINFYGYIFGVVINLLIAIIIREPFNSNFASPAWMANIGFGIVGFAGSGLTVYGFKFIEAHKGSIVLLSEILFGILFGF